MQDLRGKVALVTGGGQGLGEAICRSLAEAGVVVAVADIREDQAERVAASLRCEDGRAMALRLDVSDDEQAQAAVARVAQDCGRLDILVNNAGTDVTLPVEELTVRDWDRIIAVNLRGPFVMSKHAMAQMRSQGSGHIVNIASTAAKRAWANASAYHASKWGLLGLSQALYAELRSQGIRVSTVIAGGMKTPFLLERFKDIDQTKLQDPANVAEAVRFVLTLPRESIVSEIMVLPLQE